MYITSQTLKIIRDNIKNKKYIKDTGTLKVSFSEYLEIIMKLKEIQKEDPDNKDLEKALFDMEKGMKKY